MQNVPYLLRILLFFNLLIGSIGINTKEKCTECRFLVATFNEGLNRTSKSHFGGGNTAWEERKLRKFTASEIRFAEVMEFICKKNFLSDTHEYNAKDLEFKCHALAEDEEETLERWFFEFQSIYPDLETYICIDQLKRCCRTGHFGPSCTACPGYFSTLNETSWNKMAKPRECFGRGSCNGSGTREGTGKCNCDLGYMGKMCSNCAAHYFPLLQTGNFIECEECFDGCAGGCTASGPKGCRACRTGYVMDEQDGCRDIDECDELVEDGDKNEMRKCNKGHEKCVNTAGSYRCECEDGYKRNEDAQHCELDVEEPEDYVNKNAYADTDDNEKIKTVSSPVAAAMCGDDDLSGQCSVDRPVV